jgi:hypothetical protein
MSRRRPNKLVLLASASLAAVICLLVPSLVSNVAASPSLVASKTFKLFPNKPFLNCLQPTGVTASAKMTVTRGNQNDNGTLTLTGFKPNLGFDMFTVQNSNQTATGGPVSGFTNFGMAWYQSDVETDSSGNATVKIKTILLDQIFGFDPAVALAPTQTLHVGFWFDSVQEAQPCSATTLVPTPFNGEHTAGPVAFITRPDATTGLGPLCTQPVSSGGVFHCNP